MCKDRKWSYYCGHIATWIGCESEDGQKTRTRACSFKKPEQPHYETVLTRIDACCSPACCQRFLDLAANHLGEVEDQIAHPEKPTLHKRSPEQLQAMLEKAKTDCEAAKSKHEGDFSDCFYNRMIAEDGPPEDADWPGAIKLL